MELKEFINQKVQMLKNEFSNDQIKKEVYEYCFKNYMPNIPLNTIIELSMDIYSEIILLYSNEKIFKKILSFYCRDGNPEVFKDKIIKYQNELLPE